MAYLTGKPARRRSAAADLVAAAAAVASLLAIIWANVQFFDPPAVLNRWDEGYIHAIGVRMLEGELLPYVDGVSHRGPLLYWTAAAGAWLFGRHSWLSVRVLGSTTMLLTALLAYLAGRAARRPFAGATAAIAVALVSLVAMTPYDGMSYNGEFLLNVFALGALCCATAGLGDRSAPPRLGLVAAAGLCAALGALSKQNGATVVPALGIWVLAASLTRPRTTSSQRWLPLAAFAAGAALPVLITVAAFAAKGHLGTLYYYLFTYNFDVYMAVLTQAQKDQAVGQWIVSQSVLLAGASLLLLWGLARPLIGPPGGFLRRWDSDGFAPTVALGALLGLLSCNATLRNFWHYYIQIVPWFGLLAGLVVDEAIRRRTRGWGRTALYQALVLLPATVTLFWGWGWKKNAYREGQRLLLDEVEPLCEAVDSRSAPGDALFVWGFRPDLYTWCRRRPASRYVFTTFVAGFVPWAFQLTKEEEDRLSVPGSRQILLDELEAAKPPIIIDAGASMGGRDMTRYELLAGYLERRYCPSGTRRQYEFYLRRDDAGKCPPALPADTPIPTGDGTPTADICRQVTTKCEQLLRSGRFGPVP